MRTSRRFVFRALCALGALATMPVAAARIAASETFRPRKVPLGTVVQPPARWPGKNVLWVGGKGEVVFEDLVGSEICIPRFDGSGSWGVFYRPGEVRESDGARLWPIGRFERWDEAPLNEGATWHSEDDPIPARALEDAVAGLDAARRLGWDHLL